MPASPFIVAEMSANHLGSLTRALQIVEAAADAGADAIKVQTWSPDLMCIDPEYGMRHGPWAGIPLMDLYREAWLPWEWHKSIFDAARARGLIPFSAAFDPESVDFLETLGVDRHKVASFELTDLPLIRYMASKGKSMILSTGMSTYVERERAFWVARECWRDVTVLHCVSAYPAEAQDFNLIAMRGMFGGLFGLSDHSAGVGVACAAAALGAKYIEKHLTLSRGDGGPDAGFSAEPNEFRALVVETRNAAAAISARRHIEESTALRRSLWVCADIEAGEPLRFGVNVRTARPALGMSPDIDLIGRRASRFLRARTPLTAECLA